MGLDTGQCPRWLFERMVKLGRRAIELVVEEEGPEAFIRRLADPAWFQSLGTVLAFDWNASGLTTILTAALKESLRGDEDKLGIYICGGKGKTSLRAPEEIRQHGGDEKLVYTSKMAAKVDSSLVQDGYQLYHHTFFFSPSGAWTVVQQGMNESNATARRYHWHSSSATELINDPHSGIVSQILNPKSQILNLTAEKSRPNRNLAVELVDAGYKTVMKEVSLLRKYWRGPHPSTGSGQVQLTLLDLADNRADFHWQPVVNEDFSKSQYLDKILQKVCWQGVKTYEQLLATAGVGPKTIRALALVGEVIYGAQPSYEDPARYSFAHGGKDAVPYPVDRKTYDRTIEILAKK